MASEGKAAAPQAPRPASPSALTAPPAHGPWSRVPVLVTGLTVAILAATILLTGLYLRQRIRQQMASRDAEALGAVVLMLQQEGSGAAVGPDESEDPLAHSVVLLKASKLGHVLAARLFDREGHFLEAFPPNVLDAPLEPGLLPHLRRLRPASRFVRAARLSEVFAPDETAPDRPETPVPLLEVHVPLVSAREPRLAGVAQFILDGQSLAEEYARLDGHLARQAGAAFLVGGGIVVLALGWAFGRLRAAHRQLARRTADLWRANEELALAARTSAVGALAAHLIHGLRSPLSGLQSFVTSVSAGDADPTAAEWQQAVASTRRMQSLINQVVEVLREQDAAGRYEVTLTELAAAVVERLAALAEQRGVTLRTRLSGEVALPNRAANLLTLILVNLTQNALEATPAGRAVTLVLNGEAGRLVCEVHDQGPGIPETVRPQLFQPCRSAKEGGSGIGLAICRQLAQHLGAGLDLRHSGPEGSVFVLTLPLAAAPSAHGGATLTLSG